MSAEGLIVKVFIVLGLIVLIVGPILYFRQRKQEKGYYEDVKKMGFSFSGKSSTALLGSLERFDIFSPDKGDRTIYKVIEKVIDNIDIKFFYYDWNKQEDDFGNYIVASFRSDHLSYPPFLLGPKHLFDKFKNAFGIGLNYIDFSEYPKFSKMYSLRGENESKIRLIFKPKLISFYEEHKGLHTEAYGNQLIFYKQTDTSSLLPKEFLSFVEQGLSVLPMFRSK